MDRVIRRLSLRLGTAACLALPGLACWPMDDLSSYSEGTAIAPLEPRAEARVPDVLRADNEDVPRAVFEPDLTRPLDAGEGLALPADSADAGAGNACGGEGEAFDAEASVCYRLSPGVAPWVVAEWSCRAQGARLVTIGSRHEDEFLGESFDVTFWTGANDRSVEGRFEWASDEAFNFSNFDSGEPNNLFGLQDCVEKLLSGGRWHDRDCSVQNRFVCERAGSTSIGG